MNSIPITELTSFIGPINIDTSSRGVIEDLQEYCVQVEADALEKLLGESLYTEYLNDDTEARFTELINGKADIFTYNDKKMKYTGLKDKFCYLIYNKYLQDQFASNTPFGDVAPTPSNGTYQVNEPRIVNAYNKWVDAFNKAVDYIRYRNSIDPTTFEGFTTSKLQYFNTFGI